MSKSVYVQIGQNQIRILCADSQRSTEKFGEFSTPRLAIGDFDLALQLIKNGIREVEGRSFLLLAPIVVMHQVYLGETELSKVESRLLYEIGYLAGGHPVHIWQGAALSAEEILQKRYLEKRG